MLTRKRLAIVIGLCFVPASPVWGQSASTDKTVMVLSNQALTHQQRVEGVFSQAGAYDCKEFADKAYGNTDLNVFERRDALTGVLDCLKRVQGVTIQKMAAGKATDVFVVQQSYAATVERAEADLARANARADFMNMSWGVGFGYSFGFDDVIEDAELDGNDIVRSKKDNTDQPRLVLEFHRYFLCNDKQRKGTRGCGPFVAVTTGNDEIVTGVGTGWMVGWKSKNDTSDQGFSIGIGVLLDADVKSLASGFEEDQPLPAGETSIRFEEKSRWSGLLFFTRTF